MNEQSVVRRSIVLIAFVLPGLLLNFGLVIVATHLLEQIDFGIFYLSVNLVVMLSAPVVVISFVVSRDIVLFNKDHSLEEAFSFSVQIVRSCLRMSVVLFAASLAILLLAAVVLDVSTPMIAWAIAFNILAVCLVEISRGILQGFKNVPGLGGFSAGWMLLRFLLGGAFLFLFSTAWGGLFGMALAGGLAFLGFANWLQNKKPSNPASVPIVWRKDALAAYPLVIIYSATVAIAFLDIVIAYLILDRTDFATYAATSVLPKALFAVTLPVLQILFPLAISETSRKKPLAKSLLKAILATVMLCLFGSGVILIFSSNFCGGPYGVQYCDDAGLPYLLAAATFACLLRVVVLTKVPKEECWQLYMVVPLIILVTSTALSGAGDSIQLAKFYCGATAGIFTFALIFSVMRNIRIGNIGEY